MEALFLILLCFSGIGTCQRSRGARLREYSLAQLTNVSSVTTPAHVVSSTTAIPTTTTTATTTTSTATTTSTLYGVDYEGSGYVDWIFNLSSRPFTVAAGTVTTASTGTLSDTRFSTVTTPSLDPYLDSRLGHIAQSTSTSYPSTGSSSVSTTVRTTSSTSKPTTSVYLTTTTKPVTTTLPFRLTSTASTRKYTTTAKRFFTTVKRVDPTSKPFFSTTTVARPYTWTPRSTLSYTTRFTPISVPNVSSTIPSVNNNHTSTLPTVVTFAAVNDSSTQTVTTTTFADPDTSSDPDGKWVHLIDGLLYSTIQYFWNDTVTSISNETHGEDGATPYSGGVYSWPTIISQWFKTEILGKKVSSLLFPLN